MKSPADAVSTVFTHDGKSLFFNVLLYGRAHIAEPLTWGELVDTQPHAVEGNLCQSLRLAARFTHEIHATGVAVESLFDNRDIDIDRITGLERALARNAVTNDMIDRCAN